ncbi:MAG TPA: hypothetical protein VKM55_15985 [Candidatus Lokiarchaeia archaeon]|nr:hypothetical protein [Candidatus Lokiarchaeia archaeon]
MKIRVLHGKREMVLAVAMLCSLWISIAMTFTSSSPLAKSTSNVSQTTPSGTITPSNQYQGSGDSLTGNSTATYHSSSTGLQATNTSSTNVPLFIDQAHGWKATKVKANITNIKDTRDWVHDGTYNNTRLNALNATASRVPENLWYPNNGSYYPNMDLGSTGQTYSDNTSRAIQLHFKYIHMNMGDAVNITDLDGNTLQTITGNYTNFLSDWFDGSQVTVGYQSGNDAGLPDAYMVDYINSVPVNATIAANVESAHPYPLNMDGTTGNVLDSSNSSLKYMRVHFTRMELEGNGYDYLQLYDNSSTNFITYDAASANPPAVNLIDHWSPWTLSNQISLNLTSDSSNTYWGYKVDKYQLSAIDPAQYDANAKQINIHIYWNNYLINHTLGDDSYTVNETGATFMRLDFSYINFEKGYDYLVLLDNESRFLMDYTGLYNETLTQWFPTDAITLTYVSDTSGIGNYVGIQKLNLGAKIDYYEYSTTTTVNASSRKNAWTFNGISTVYAGRTSGYSAIKAGRLGLAVEIDGQNENPYYATGYYTYEYEYQDNAAFSQDIPVPRGRVTNAYLHMDYYAEKIMPSNDFSVYCAINGSVVWSRGFTSISSQPNEWLTTGNIYMPLWTNDSSLFDSMGNESNVNISVGIAYVSPFGVDYTLYPNVDRQVVVLDNIQLVLMTSANASQPDIALQVNGTMLIDNATTWGAAQYEASGQWAHDPLTLTFTTSSPSLTFDATMILDMETKTNTTRSQNFNDWGTIFSVSPGNSVSWSLYQNIYIPSGYHNYMLNVAKPRSWTITSVFDPTGIAVSFQGGTTSDGSFTVATTTSGWFRMNAQSGNGLGPTSLSTDNASWNSSLTLMNKQTWYAKAPFSHQLSSLSGNTSLLVRAPNDTTWCQKGSPVTLTMDTEFGPFTFDSQNTTGGAFTGFIAWENGTDAGFSHFAVSSVHTTRVQAIFPMDARAGNSTSQLAGSIIPIRLSFNDTFSKRLISGAMLDASLNSTPSVNFTFVESAQGVYDYSLDVGTIAEGNYRLAVVATKQGYVTGAFNLAVHLNVNTLIENYTNYNQVQSGFNTTISFQYHDINRNIGLPGASITVAGLSGALYSIQDHANGTYSIVLNSTGLAVGSHVYTIFMQKQYCTSQLVIGTLAILPKNLIIGIKGNNTNVQATPGSSIKLVITIVDRQGHPMTGVNVSYSWAGGLGFFTDEQNGTYEAMLTMPKTEGAFDITVSAYVSENYTCVPVKIYLQVQQPPVSLEQMLGNIIAVAIIIVGFFLLIFLLYLRPRIIKRKLTRFEDVKICTVHKGPIKGLTYMCPNCSSIYCTECAQALFNNNETCWVCHTPIAPFAVSYEQDWRSNLQYFLIYLNGNPEPIFQQSMVKDDVLVADALKYLLKTIGENIVTINKKKLHSDVQEYFNSKIIFQRGDIVTVVVVSKIESSFINEKLKGFVDEFEDLFFEKNKHWKEGARDKFVTTIQTLIEKIFTREEKEEKLAQGPKDKGKKKGSKEGKYVDAADLIHKAKIQGTKDKYAPAAYKVSESKDRPPESKITVPEEKINIPVTMPEPQPSSQEEAASGETMTNLEDLLPADPEVRAAMAALGEMFSAETNAEAFLPPGPPGSGVTATGKPKRDEEPGEGKEDHDPASNDGNDS